MDAIEKRARGLLASCLDEWGHPCEAENVREGEDLDSYESELRLISQLLCFGMDTAESHARAALATRQPVGDCSESALYEAVGNLLEAPGSWTSGYTDALHDLREAYSRYGQKPVMQGPLAEVSSKSFNSDGTSNIITPSLPLGTKLYAALTPPEGYVLVPVEITKEIGEALDESIKYRYSSESAWDLAIYAARAEVNA